MTEPITLSTQAEPLTNDTHVEHLRITAEWALLFGAVFAVVIVLSAVIGVLLTIATPPIWLLLPFGSAFVGAAIVAMAAVRSLEYSRYCLQTRFEEWVKNQEVGREIARLQASQVNNISVRGKSNTVTIGQSQAVESVRLVPVHTSGRLVDGVDSVDLAHFVERVCLVGHTKRQWIGQQLPSGKLVTTFSDYDQLISPLVKCGVLVGRGERSAGHLTTNDPQTILGRLGLASGQEVKEVPGG